MAIALAFPPSRSSILVHTKARSSLVAETAEGSRPRALALRSSLPDVEDLEPEIINHPTLSTSCYLQALLESAFITVMPILLLAGDRHGMGVVTSLYDYGTATFVLVVMIVSFKARAASEIYVKKERERWEMEDERQRRRGG